MTDLAQIILVASLSLCSMLGVYILNIMRTNLKEAMERMQTSIDKTIERMGDLESASNSFVTVEASRKEVHQIFTNLRRIASQVEHIETKLTEAPCIKSA